MFLVDGEHSSREIYEYGNFFYVVVLLCSSKLLSVCILHTYDVKIFHWLAV